MKIELYLEAPQSIQNYPKMKFLFMDTVHLKLRDKKNKYFFFYQNKPQYSNTKLISAELKSPDWCYFLPIDIPTEAKRSKKF